MKIIHLYYFPSYLLAILWTFFWGNWRWIDGYRKDEQGKKYWSAYNSKYKMSFMWGRHKSPEPIRCECGWMGPVRWLVHTYGDDGSGEDVKPVDKCPRCGGEI